MSGPKTSSYYLSKKQLKQLQEQIMRIREAQILEERKANELEIIKSHISELTDILNAYQGILDRISNISKEGHDTEYCIIDATEKCKKAEDIIKKDKTINQKSSIEKISDHKKNILEIIKSIKSEYSLAEKALKKQENNILNDFYFVLKDAFSISFENISDRKALEENIFYKKIIDELKKLSEINISENQKARFNILKSKASDIKSTDFLENFLSISIRPFVKECIEYDNLENSIGEEYRLLCLRYEYLAKELGHNIEKVELSPDSIQILLQKISGLEEEYLKIKEQEYICNCIEEAMNEMNYSMVGQRNVIKKNGKRFNSTLYKFDEGSAVNVTYTSEGNIIMELGGITREDRSPNALECEYLETDMKKFCSDFKEIEEKLRKKGIESNRLSHLPADAQFAQLINISDYNMLEIMDDYSTDNKRRKNNTSESALYKEDK